MLTSGAGKHGGIRGSIPKRKDSGYSSSGSGGSFRDGEPRRRDFALSGRDMDTRTVTDEPRITARKEASKDCKAHASMWRRVKDTAFVKRMGLLAVKD